VFDYQSRSATPGSAQRSDARKLTDSNGLSAHPLERQCTVGRHDQSIFHQVFDGHFAVGRLNIPRPKQLGLIPGAHGEICSMTVATKDDETEIVDSLPAPAATIAIK
jgi:hypothetical protein